MPIDPGIYNAIRPQAFNNPFESLGQIMALRNQRDYRQQQIESQQALEEERRQKLQTAQQEQRQKIAIADAYRASFEPEKGLNRQKFQQILSDNGYGPAWADIVKGLDAADKTSSDALAARAAADKAEIEYARTGAKLWVDSGFDDGVLDSYLTHAELNGHDVKPFQQLRQQDPNKLREVAMGLAYTPEERAKQTTAAMQNEQLQQQLSGTTPITPYQQAQLNETAEHNRAMEAKPTAAMQAYSGTEGDAEDIAQAIIRGEQPPDLTAMYRLGGPVRAALARGKYDLTKASEDWNATKKYLQTLNGAQQVRLRQAVDFTKESLSSVKQLATEWNAPTWGPLSRARLALAKSGSLGQQAKETATKIDAQIADVVSELATVYKGGNSSTDESLKLAAKNLSAEWDAKTMLANLAQIDQNLGYRQNSMRTAGVANIQGENRYAPPGAKPDQTKTEAAAPDLAGLQPGHSRKFTAGPFAGQTWKIGPDGKPQREN